MSKKGFVERRVMVLHFEYLLPERKGFALNGFVSLCICYSTVSATLTHTKRERERNVGGKTVTAKLTWASLLFERKSMHGNVSDHDWMIFVLQVLS